MSFAARLNKIESTRERAIEIARSGDNYQEWLQYNYPTMIWDKPHLVYLQEKLDRIISGKLKRLLISEPPRHGKSEMCTIKFPNYFFCKYPAARIGVAAYNQDFANGFSRQTRAQAGKLFKISKIRDAAAEWYLQSGALYRCFGIRSGITGKGFNLFIVDDPIKNRKEAQSETFRNEVGYGFGTDLYTRLEPSGAIIVILTRWHEDDLIGRILNSEHAGEWEVVNIPALAEEDDPLGRKIDEPLWPERFSYDELLKTKQVLGHDFYALYQGRPSPAEGMIFPVDKIVDYNDLPKFSFIVQGWDTAVKDKEVNDYSVGITIGVATDGYYILDRVKARMQMPALKQAIKDAAYKWDPNIVLIEDKSSGSSAVQEIKSITRVPVLAVNVDTSKLARAEATTDAIETGLIHLPKFAPWKEDFIHQLSTFPNATHDDDVDAYTLLINYLTKRFANTLAVYKQYNTLIHDLNSADKPELLDFYIGINIDNVVSAVLVGVTEHNTIVAMKEFTYEAGIESFIANKLKPYLKKVLGTKKPTFYVRSERKDAYWAEILIEQEIDYTDMSLVDESEMIDRVKEILSILDEGVPKFSLLPKTCADLREGFIGAYCYKARSKTDADYDNKPIKNKYSRLQVALQVALYEYKDYVDYSHETINDKNLDYERTGRSKVGGY